jgi:hypothetical protein
MALRRHDRQESDHRRQADEQHEERRRSSDEAPFAFGWLMARRFYRARWRACEA